MRANLWKTCRAVVVASSMPFLAAATNGAGWAQQPAAPAASGQGALDKARDKSEAAREKAKEKIEAARDTKQGARETTRDVREGTRETARDDRQTTRDTRVGARDTVREDRQTIRESRRDVRAARREFIASRIRSGDFGLWLRGAGNGTSGLTVSDVSGRGAIAQTGLKEGDEIISVNGQPVTSERQFVDKLFADHANNQTASVVIKRNGKEQTVSIATKPFVDEHLASDNRLHDFGLILDESNPSHVKVQAVIPRSPAFYAGVRSGDQITGFHGQRITAIGDLVRSIANAAGGSAPLEVNRNNQTRQLEIDIPDEDAGDETRTTLKPVLPNTNSTAPQLVPPQPSPARSPAATQPKLNPPR